MTVSSQRHSSWTQLTGHIAAYPWAYYLLLLLAIGFAQFWDARLFTWFADDFRALDHIEKIGNNVGVLFSPDHVDSGRPATTLYIMAFAAIWGDYQTPVHLGLIMFHILASWTLAWTLGRVGYETFLGMMTGLLFLFSVSSYEVPYWVSCLSYPGSLAFGCLGIVNYLQHTSTHRRSPVLLSVASFAISASFHAGGIVFTFLALYFGWRRKVAWSILVRSGWIPVVTSAGISVIFLLTFPLHVQNESTTHAGDPFHLAWVTTAYLGRTFLSSHWLSQSLLYVRSALDFVVGCLLLGVAIVMIVYKRVRPVDAIVWSALALPIFSGTNHLEYQSRYFYFANVGPALLLAWLLIRAAEWLGAGRGSVLKTGIRGAGVACILTISHLQHERAEAVFWGADGTP